MTCVAQRRATTILPTHVAATAVPGYWPAMLVLLKEDSSSFSNRLMANFVKSVWLLRPRALSRSEQQLRVIAGHNCVRRDLVAAVATQRLQ